MEERILLISAVLVLLGTHVSGATVGDALASINGSYSVVYGFNASTGAWMRYLPGGASNTLTVMTVADGYWVKMTSAGTLNVSGTEPSSTIISLATGWNLMGYPKLTAGAVGTVLTGIDGKYSVVYGFNASSGAWMRYLPGGASNTLTNMVAGSGYWIKMTSADTLTIS